MDVIPGYCRHFLSPIGLSCPLWHDEGLRWVIASPFLAARYGGGHSFVDALKDFSAFGRNHFPIREFSHWRRNRAIGIRHINRAAIPARFLVQCDGGCGCRWDGNAMTHGFVDIDHLNSAQGTATGYLRLAVGWLPIAVILAAAVGLLTSDYVRRRPANGPVRAPAATATNVAPPVTVGLARHPSFDPSISEAIVPEQPAPADGVKISSQSWRRGGLGSNAFLTMTLRNANDFAVGDIEISCAFARSDGVHLTDRTRLIHASINGKSRKTLARLHVGFVNPNAAKASCSVVAASRI